MLKKSLLTSIALICLNLIEATQTTDLQNPTQHEPMHHSQNSASYGLQPSQHPAHYGATHHSQNPTPYGLQPPHSPVHHEPMQKPVHPNNLSQDANKCPCGGVSGWVLIPAGPGTSCNQTAAEEKTAPHHTPVEEPHVTPHKPSLHPLPTPEEEKLAEELKLIPAHMFRRADPNNPHAEKRGESGKALHGKVYFQHLGIWKYDPSVHATTDIISTSVKDRVRMLNEQGKNQQGPENPASTETGKHHPVHIPDALGTTEGRVQSVHTNPTEGNQRQFGLGAPNRAQTHVTGNAIPEADTSGSKPAVSPPSNIKAELNQQ